MCGNDVNLEGLPCVVKITVEGTPMKSLPLAAAIVLAFTLVGCGTSGSAPIEVDAGESAPPQESGGDTDACGGLTTAHLTSIFGVELEGPEAETGSSTQNEASWTNVGCDWENDASELELDLDLAVPADFADGSIVCVEPGGVGDVTPVDGIGNQAWWSFYDFDEVEGKLRVCTDDALVEFSVDAKSGSIGSDELRDKAVEAVRVVVG